MADVTYVLWNGLEVTSDGVVRTSGSSEWTSLGYWERRAFDDELGSAYWLLRERVGWDCDRRYDEISCHYGAHVGEYPETSAADCPWLRHVRSVDWSIRALIFGLRNFRNRLGEIRRVSADDPLEPFIERLGETLISRLPAASAAAA
ncbi:MAG: hypothetical protein OXQ29_06780 [Rhodospirillaceae bacterium]|nr:hypothetical protein [Rhodospirillaceae bacterium]